MQKWKTLQKMGAWIAIISAILFTGIGILGVWDILGSDNRVVYKALSSLAILCFSGLVFLALGRLGQSTYKPTDDESPSFTSSVRNIVILSMTFLTLPHAAIVLFVIWGDIYSYDLFTKAITSFFILLIGTIIVIKGVEAIEKRSTPLVASVSPQNSPSEQPTATANAPYPQYAHREPPQS